MPTRRLRALFRLLIRSWLDWHLQREGRSRRLVARSGCRACRGPRALAGIWEGDETPSGKKWVARRKSSLKQVFFPLLELTESEMSWSPLLFLSSFGQRGGSLQDRHGFGLVQQDVGTEADGFVGPRMMVDHQIAERSMGGLLIHLPEGSTVSQPAIAQGFHIPGVGGVLEQHRVMVVAVLAGLFSSSRI